MGDFQIDNVDEIVGIFENLSSKERKKAITNSLRKGIGILVKQTRQNLKKIVPTANKVTTKGAFKGNKLSNGIRVKVWKNKQAVTASIMKDGRLKWFELGTKERTTKNRTKRKTHSTGQMQPTNFFRDAKQQTEEKVFNSINQIISDEIQKIWDKKK